MAQIYLWYKLLLGGTLQARGAALGGFYISKRNEKKRNGSVHTFINKERQATQVTAVRVTRRRTIEIFGGCLSG